MKTELMQAAALAGFEEEPFVVMLHASNSEMLVISDSGWKLFGRRGVIRGEGVEELLEAVSLG